MVADPLIFRVHAVQRMFQRRISTDDVRHVLETGEVVEDYPDDMPYPSRLVLGWCGSRPIHVVAAENTETQETTVITVYEPDSMGARIQEEETMKCVVCKQAGTRPGKATVTLERDGLTQVIKGVPARVCENCGEEYLDEEITVRLLQAAEEAARAGVQVDIREYVAV